jgi:hypothetical protein
VIGEAVCRSQKRRFRRLVEEAETECYERARANCELEALLSEEPTELNVRSHLHNRRQYRDPNAQPVKWMKLIQWWLVHRVPIDMIITPPVEAAACMRFKIPESKWEDAKQRFPKLLIKVSGTILWSYQEGAAPGRSDSRMSQLPTSKLNRNTICEISP